MLGISILVLFSVSCIQDLGKRICFPIAVQIANFASQEAPLPVKLLCIVFLIVQEFYHFGQKLKIF